MPSNRKPSLILPVAVAAMLLAGYVGAYYAMVEPAWTGHSGTNGVHPRAFYSWGRLMAKPDSAVDRFFTPIRWLDCRIRPRVWELTP